MTEPRDRPRRSPLRGLLVGIAVAIVVFPSVRHTIGTVAVVVLGFVAGTVLMAVVLLSGHRPRR